MGMKLGEEEENEEEEEEEMTRYFPSETSLAND